MRRGAGARIPGLGRAALVAPALILLGVACLGPPPTFKAGTYMNVLQTRRRIVIGVKYDIPRFGLLNPETGEVTGFDVDLGKEIAKRLRVQPEFVEAISPNRIPLLLDDEVDLVISTMTINEERRAQIDFSDVYYIAQQRLLVRRDSKIQGVKSLEAERAPVCSGEQSTSAQYIAAAAPHAPLRLEKRYSECARLVRETKVEALFTDDVILTGLLSQDPGRFKIVGDPVTVEHYGMGIKKGRPEFVAFVNDVIKDIKDDGTWGMLYANWIGQVTGGKVDPPPAEPEPGPAPGPRL